MMSRAAQYPAESTTTLTIRVPLAMRKRGGRRLVIAPAVAATCRPASRTDGEPLLTALARAWRWQRLIENGPYASLGDFAAAEGVDRSYAGKVIRLMLLAPDLIEAIIDGTQPETMTLDRLFKAFSSEWGKQRLELLGTA